MEALNINLAVHMLTCKAACQIILLDAFLLFF